MPEAVPVPVTVENFIRAETDLYLSVVALKEGGFGKFEHHRELSPVDAQTIIRMNRDTLYSAAVFDLDAGPVTITLHPERPMALPGSGAGRLTAATQAATPERAVSFKTCRGPRGKPKYRALLPHSALAHEGACPDRPPSPPMRSPPSSRLG